MRGRCKHFTGTQNTTCAAGICYTDVRVDGEPKEYVSYGTTYTHRSSLPCLDKYNLHGATCDKREVQTEEEIAAEEAEHKASAVRCLKARTTKQSMCRASSSKAIRRSSGYE